MGSKETNRVELIAEFCQNHNGDLGLLQEMVFAAAEAGATVGKMQTIFSDRVAFRPQFERGIKEGDEVLSIHRPYVPEVKRLKGLEVSFEAQKQFVKWCEKAGLVPMTTCFSRDTARAIHDAGFRQIKVASYDCASYPLLRELRALFDRVIVSTGAMFDDEIRHAASILQGHPSAFLHCVTIYPTPLNEMHLARMEFLRELCPVVGFSDHSLVSRDRVIAAKVAIALGAQVIERHFTVLPPDQTKDGPVSITVEMLKELSDFSRLSREEQMENLRLTAPGWEACRGTRSRMLSKAELLNRDYFRGRFASLRKESREGKNMIFNWEETPLS